MDIIIRKSTFRHFLLGYDDKNCFLETIMRYILASKSPRRREILQSIGLDFTVFTADTDETSSITDPAALVKELSLRKGRATADELSKKGELSADDIIIASDTVVAYDCEILGKPRDRDDARRMLKLLSGKKHRVLSGIALIKGDASFVSFSETFVYFNELDDALIERYLDTAEPYDKAGAYGIQGIASVWVDRIEGSYLGVVGLPVSLLDKLHRECTGASIF